MVYSQEKKSKLTKYCYRMNKACSQRDFLKVSDYFNHLKHHAMKGGELSGDVKQLFGQLETSINGAVGKINQVEKDNSVLLEEKKLLEQRLADVNLSLTQAEQKLVAKEKELEAKEKELELKEQQIIKNANDHSSGAEQLRAEAEKLLKQIAALELQIKTLNDRVTALETEEQKLNGQLLSISSERDVLANANKDLGARVTQYNNAFSLMKGLATANNQGEVDSITWTEPDVGQEALKNLEAIKAAVKARLEAGVVNDEALKRQLEALVLKTDKEIADLKFELQQAKDGLTAKDVTIKDLGEKESNYNTQIDDLKKNLTQAASINTDDDLKDVLEKIIAQLNKINPSASSSNSSSNNSSTVVQTPPPPPPPQPKTAAGNQKPPPKTAAVSGNQSAQSSNKKFKKGDRVKITGMTASTEFNDKLGTIGNDGVTNKGGLTKYLVNIDKDKGYTDIQEFSPDIPELKLEKQN